MIRYITDKLKTLRHLWLYSDSQPTEITLATANILLAPIATYIELGPMLVYQLLLIITGIYQLLCVVNNDISCRVRASLFTFGLYVSTLIMYLYCMGLPTPSHYGWFVLTISAFGSLRRLTREKITRNG